LWDLKAYTYRKNHPGYPTLKNHKCQIKS